MWASRHMPYLCLVQHPDGSSLPVAACNDLLLIRRQVGARILNYHVITLIMKMQLAGT